MSQFLRVFLPTLTQKVWETFSCETLGDYHDLYLKTDVTLLADEFQTFRRTCMNAYKLDPLHYYTAPGLSWDALLKHNGIELELLTDYDQHLLIEIGMRGGVSMTSKRHAKANNPAFLAMILTKSTIISYITMPLNSTAGS